MLNRWPKHNNESWGSGKFLLSKLQHTFFVCHFPYKWFFLKKWMRSFFGLIYLFFRFGRGSFSLSLRLVSSDSKQINWEIFRYLASVLLFMWCLPTTSGSCRVFLQILITYVNSNKSTQVWPLLAKCLNRKKSANLNLTLSEIITPPLFLCFKCVLASLKKNITCQKYH